MPETGLLASDVRCERKDLEDNIRRQLSPELVRTYTLGVQSWSLVSFPRSRGTRPEKSSQGKKQKGKKRLEWKWKDALLEEYKLNGQLTVVTRR